MHDASLSLSIHTTCARLMLNLVSIQNLSRARRFYVLFLVDFPIKSAKVYVRRFISFSRFIFASHFDYFLCGLGGANFWERCWSTIHGWSTNFVGMTFIMHLGRSCFPFFVIFLDVLHVHNLSFLYGLYFVCSWFSHKKTCKKYLYASERKEILKFGLNYNTYFHLPGSKLFLLSLQGRILDAFVGKFSTFKRTIPQVLILYPMLYWSCWFSCGIMVIWS